MNNLKINTIALTDKGEFKKLNEDSLWVKIGEFQNSEFGVFMVCDGVGGLDCGDIASYCCVKLLKSWWQNTLPHILHKIITTKSQNIILNELNKIVKKINDEIIIVANEKNVKMGTTITLLFIFEDIYCISHVGDSRMYLYNRGDISQITEDHTLVNYQIKNGEITSKEALKSKNKHILTQCLGVKEEIQIFNRCGEIKGNETILICSDGFYNKLNINEIKQICKLFKRNREQDILLKYLHKVRKRGEIDNISAILINCYKSEGIIKRFLSSIKGI